MTATCAMPSPAPDGLYLPTQAQPLMPSRLLIIVAVVGFHVLGLWALQSGLLRRVIETVVPVQVLADFVERPQPQAEPAPPPPQPKVEPLRQRPATRTRAPALRPEPAPLPVTEATPIAPIEVANPAEPDPVPAPPATAASAAPAVSAAPTSSAPAAEKPASVVLPSSNAAYLNNPPPRYPPLSRRMGEQGKVVVRAFIDIDGTATRAEIARSSGFDRLDQAALQTVQRWRYVPGKRGDVPQGMWSDIPISFVLE